MKTFEELLSEETKGSRLEIPLSILSKIKTYQIAWKNRFGKRISRELVILKMIHFGLTQIEGEIEKLNDTDSDVQELSFVINSKGIKQK